MLESIFGSPSLAQALLALFILLAFVGLALIFRFVLVGLVRRFVRKTKTALDDVILPFITKPVIVIIILGGVYLSVSSLPLADLAARYITRGLAMALSLLGLYTVTALLNTVIIWYGKDSRQKKREVGLTNGILGFFRVMMLLFAVFLGVLVSLRIWGLDSDPVIGWMGEDGWRILMVVILSIIVVVAIGEGVPRLVVKSLARRAGELEEEVGKRGNTLSRVLTNSGQVFVLLIGTFTILSEFISIAPVLASAGVVGIAIGFGAQSLIRDLLAGVFILMENQYRVGDVVKIADIGGLVEDINLRRTVLRDLDGIVHFVPNGEIRVASNFTKEWSRVNLNISVAYGEDLDHVTAVIDRVGKQLADDPQWAPLILKAPQVLRVDNLGESGIDIKILGDTKPIQQWAVTGELRRRIKKAFDEEGIEIPWPHTKVYFGDTTPFFFGDQTPAAKRKTNGSEGHDQGV